MCVLLFLITCTTAIEHQHTDNDNEIAQLTNNTMAREHIIIYLAHFTKIVASPSRSLISQVTANGESLTFI